MAERGRGADGSHAEAQLLSPTYDRDAHFSRGRGHDGEEEKASGSVTPEKRYSGLCVFLAFLSGMLVMTAVGSIVLAIVDVTC